MHLFQIPLRLIVLLLASLASGATTEASPSATADAGTRTEVRALWVVRTSLTSPASIESLVRDASASGVNTLLVQVRGRGDAFYGSGLEPRSSSLAGQPADFDPLAEILRLGRAAGLSIHAWINVNLVSSAVDLPSARSHVVNRRPEWLMVPRALGVELARVDPQNPAYVGKLARWTRSQSQVEGLFASPIHPDAVSHAAAVVADLVARYEVDGVHLDYVRFPNADFDYSAAALAAFRDSVLSDLSGTEQARLDARARIDPFVYADTFPARWAAFRRSRLTSLVMRVRHAALEARPGIVVSAAVFPGVDDAANSRLQDWRLWTEQNLIDVVCPMIYTQDAATFAAQLAEVTRIADAGTVWAGIGAYRLSPTATVANISTARALGAGGVVLFSYDSMREASTRGSDFLGDVGRAAFLSPLPVAEGGRQP